MSAHAFSRPLSLNLCKATPRADPSLLPTHRESRRCTAEMCTSAARVSAPPRPRLNVRTIAMIGSARKTVQRVSALPTRNLTRRVAHAQRDSAKHAADWPSRTRGEQRQAPPHARTRRLEPRSRSRPQRHVSCRLQLPPRAVRIPLYRRAGERVRSFFFF